MLDGTVVSCDGIVTVPVKFQDTYIMGDFYVVDKASHGTKGLDILSRLNAKIDTQNHQVIIQNNVNESMKPETPEESKGKIATVCHIRLAKTTVVQPGHEQFIWGEIPAGQVVSGGFTQTIEHKIKLTEPGPINCPPSPLGDTI